jgi:transcriptional regulator GlxA family with amidase domain
LDTYSSHPQKPLGADRPFLTTRESLDDIRSLSSVSFACGDLSVGRYRRDWPGLGITTPNAISLTPLQERRVTSRLLDDLSGDPSLSELAALCKLSRSYFIRAFKQTTGMPPHRWLLMHRVNRPQELLHGTKMPIAEIAVACGFADQSHLTRVFSKAFRVSSAWRRQWDY